MFQIFQVYVVPYRPNADNASFEGETWQIPVGLPSADHASLEKLAANLNQLAEEGDSFCVMAATTVH